LVIPKGSGGASADKPLSDSKLTLLAGDVTKQADVDQVFASKPIDGVIVALGGKTSDVGETMLTDGTGNVIRAMKANNVKRLAVVTSIGAGDSEDQAPFFFKVLMWTAMKKIFLDKNNQEDAVRKSGLEYCIVRPGGTCSCFRTLSARMCAFFVKFILCGDVRFSVFVFLTEMVRYSLSFDYVVAHHQV
jgi:nucleoside-diphosphate-sugar epimerase